MSGTVASAVSDPVAPSVREQGSPARGLRRWESALCALLVVGWVVANALWLRRERSGQPLNIDEAGYLGIALNYMGGWERGGPGGWVDVVLSPSQHAPLTTATTSLLTLVGVEDRVAAFGVVLACAVATVGFAVAFAARLAVPGAMVCTCLLVLSAPGIVGLSRNFVFAVPAAAATMAALYFLQRSRGLWSVRWAVAFGVAVGLMPLARTMMIAFVPVIVVVAIVHAAAYAVEERAWRRRVGNVALSGFIAAVVAGSWLVPSGRLVYNYLTGYGYGKHAKDYSNDAAIPPLRLLGAMGQDFFLPLLVVLAVGWGLLAWHAVRATTGDAWRPRLVRAAREPLACCVAFVIGAGLALMTSKNSGFGFTVPLIAPAVLVAVAGLLLAARRISARRATVWLVVAVTMFGALSLWPRFTEGWLGQQRTVDVLGTPVTVSNGNDTDTAYVFGTITERRPGIDDISNDPAWADEWTAVADELADDVLDGSTTRPDFAFGFRNRYMNVNVIQLEILQRVGYGVAIAQVDPRMFGTSERAYLRWLTTGPASTTCQLFLANGVINEFTPLPGTERLKDAARQVGFSKTDTVDLPDGRAVELWERNGAGC